MEINIKDFENLAKKRLDSAIFDFFCGGATDEITLKENEESYNKLKLLPRVLTGIQDTETSISLFGQTLEMPILIAPMAFQKLCHSNGELETAQGAELAKTTMIVSTYSTTPLEKISSALSRKPWFQLYILKDRGLTKAMIEQAEVLGTQALVLTVDVPAYGKRERELRNPLGMDIDLPDLQKLAGQLSLDFQLKTAKQFSAFLDHSISWQDISWLRSVTKLPILLKGILRIEDAKMAAELGINGIIISNHGGRQLDTTPPAIMVLPRIAQSVGDSLDILIDGGIRRGTDILKALALGANAVLLGRPVMWGLSVQDKEGVYKILSLLKQELKLAMILCGCKNIVDIKKELILHDII